MYKKYIKRVLDLLISILFIVLFFWLYIIIAICIKIDSKGSILFIQDRVGINNKIFKIYKFRTMKTTAPKNSPTHLLKNSDNYITKVGAILRKTSLDELPQFINVIKADMSIIGPRPALFNQYDLIEGRKKLGVDTVRPGITGLSQISGRDELSIDKKIEYDYLYLKNLSFKNDLKILIKTFFVVLSHKGIREGA